MNTKEKNMTTQPTYRKSIVTYCLITENTGEGIRLTKWCLLRPQYKAIKRAGKVVVKNIGKTSYLGLNLKNIAK